LATLAIERYSQNNPVPKAKIKSAQDLARRCATFSDLRNVRRLLPESAQALHAAAAKTCACHKLEDCGERVSRLPRSCHTVYAAIRTAAAKGYAGLRMSGREVARWIDMPLRTFWWALDKLRALQLVTRTCHFEDRAYTCVRTRKRYDKIRVANSYCLGRNAPKRKFSPPRRKGTPVQSCTTPPVQPLHNHSPYYVEGGEGRTSGPPPTHTLRDFQSPRPSANGAANRGTNTGPSGPQGAHRAPTAEERASWLADIPKWLTEPQRRPGRALRAAKKGGVAE
jgi:hypothetical protein